MNRSYVHFEAWVDLSYSGVHHDLHVKLAYACLFELLKQEQRIKLARNGLINIFNHYCVAEFDAKLKLL